MTQNIRRVRVIKRDQRSCADSHAGAEVVTAGDTKSSEHEMKTVVSGWVSEHRQRSEDFRRAFAGLLREVGFNPTPASARVN